jgi:signal transduction histidine kinase
MRIGGSGLGLSLVRSFATLHGGDMHIESAVGQGTTVTVRLPVLTSDDAALRFRRAAPG